MVQPSFLGTNNDLMLDCLNTNPNVLRGVVVVSPQITFNELQRMHQLGVRGIRLNLVGTAHQIPQWTAADSLWENMSLLGWHLEVHTDRGELPNVLQQLPTTLPLVIDHMAKPLDAKANDPSIVALLKRSKSAAINVKLSGAYRLGQISAKTTAEVLLHELGPDSLLWGSDWPCTNYEKFADFEQLIEACYEWIGFENIYTILNQNPMKLYWNEIAPQNP
jgi:predicted TIM-barrel fold metal-dependent hydrolase